MWRQVSLTLLALLGTASATPPAPVMPRTVELQAKALLAQIGAPDLALVPTRLPPQFGFDSYSVTGTPPAMDLLFTDQRFLKRPTQARHHRIVVDVSYFAGSARRCALNARKRLGTSKDVYSDGTTVWRCLRTVRGRFVRESAYGSATENVLADFVLSIGAIR